MRLGASAGANASGDRCDPAVGAVTLALESRVGEGGTVESSASRGRQSEGPEPSPSTALHNGAASDARGGPASGKAARSRPRRTRPSLQTAFAAESHAEASQAAASFATERKWTPPWLQTAKEKEEEK